MELRVYEVLFQFNQGLDLALTSLDILEQLEAESPACVARLRERLKEWRAEANRHLAYGIGSKEQGEASRLHNIRWRRKKEEENPNQIYADLETREWQRKQNGLPPRAVILPWTKADDDSAMARLKALQSASLLDATDPPSSPNEEAQSYPIESGIGQ